MFKSIINDTEATGIKEPALIEAAWLEFASIDPFTVANSFVQRYNPGKPITLGALARLCLPMQGLFHHSFHPNANFYS